MRSATELLASMRFAIALLTVISIASVIGTVLKQHEPVGNYVNQFGPFWAEVFLALKLNAVYSAWWFLLILAFLVTSTSLCIARHAPKYLRDMRNYKENIRVQNLQSFGLKAQGHLAGESAQDGATRIGQMLVGAGWKVRLQRRELPEGGVGVMVAAKSGAANKLGYIAAHSAVVLICLGGLLDGDLMVRAQMWFGGKTPYAGGGLVADVKPEHRLSLRNPTFRGNLVVAEGTQSSTAILTQSDGVLLQELPFAVELKKFTVDYYSTGMPKLFASDVVIHDLLDGKKTPARIEVNHPFSYRGVEIYQSSFDDGGSQLHLRARSMTPGVHDFDVQGVVGGSMALSPASVGKPLTLEFAGLRVINVENMSGASASGADVRKVDLRGTITAHLGAGNKTVTERELRNVGPSFSYKLRDASGQAREYNNYMLPVDTGDGHPMFLLGVRASEGESFRYLRVPADHEGSMDGFLRLRQALADPSLREQAVSRYAAAVVEDAHGKLAEELVQSTQRALALYAGALDHQGRPVPGGLQAVGQFIETTVPQAERDRAGKILLRILGGSLYELVQLTREHAGLAPLKPDAQTQAFMEQIMIALSDAQLYPAPVVFQLDDFKQVQASVFQVARAPGKKVVYLGCAFLIIGVFAMLYIRERRLWVWLAPAAGGAHAIMAMSSNRKTLDGEREFVQLRDKLIGPSLTEDSHEHGDDDHHTQ